MRTLVALFVIAAWCIPSLASAQEKKFQPPEIKKIQVGFKTFRDEDQTAFKVGLWTPIYVEVFGGTEGIVPPKGNNTPPYLKLTTDDSEDVCTDITLPVNVEPLKTRTFIGYVKTGHMGNRESPVDVNLYINNRPIAKVRSETTFPLQ